MNGLAVSWKHALRVFHLADPGYYNLVFSLQLTCSILIGAAFWAYLRPPDPFLLLLTPPMLVMLTAQLQALKRWFFFLFLTAVIIAAGCFFCSVLHNTRFLILVFIFVYVFANFSSHKYRAMGSIAIILGLMCTDFPGGWHHGVNRVITVGIGFLITAALYFAFSRAYRWCIRSMLVLILDEIRLGFCRFAGLETDAAYPELSHQDSSGNLSALGLKANVLIHERQVLLRKEAVFAERASTILHRLRMLVVDLSFLQNDSPEKDRLLALVPATDRVMRDMEQRLLRVMDSLSHGTEFTPDINEALYAQWQMEKEQVLRSPLPAFRECYKALYGLECFLEDLAQLEQKDSPTNDSPAEAPGGERPFRMPGNLLKDPVSRCKFFPAAGRSLKALLHRAPADSPPDKASPWPSEAQKGVLQEAFRVALAATLGAFLWKAAHLPHGYWVLMTIAILFSGINQGHVLQKSGDRILGTVLGLFLAYFFVKDFMFPNYLWGYTGFLFFFLMFYLYLLTGNYAIMVTILTLFAGIILSVFAGSHADFFLFGTLFNRFLCTALAVAIVIFAELSIFPNAKRSAHELERTLSSLFHDLSESVEVLSRRYVLRERLSDEEWALLTGIVEKHASSKQLHHLMQYELNLDQRYNTFCEKNIEEIGRLFCIMKRLICLSSHPRAVSLDEAQARGIEEAGRILSQTFHRMESIPADKTGRNKEGTAERIRPLFQTQAREIFFVQELEKLAETVDELLPDCLFDEKATDFQRIETSGHPGAQKA